MKVGPRQVHIDTILFIVTDATEHRIKVQLILGTVEVAGLVLHFRVGTVSCSRPNAMGPQIGWDNSGSMRLQQSPSLCDIKSRQSPGTFRNRIGKLRHNI